MYSNKLNLDEFFFAVRNIEYVIIKISEEFPNYYKGSDIDVFCNDIKEFSNSIFKVGNRYLSQNDRIEVINNEKNNHTHIDFYFNEELDFRFDLYSAMPIFNIINMKKFYFYSVIDRRSFFSREFNGKRYKIFIPNEIDSLILRYLEYLEWYEKRPDKIKHIDYIYDKMKDENKKKKMIDRIHIYAEFPPNENKEYHIYSYIMSRFFSTPFFYFKKIKSKGLVGSLKALKNKIKGRH